ncbi:hypothetical protein GII36_02575 [Candidatus Mycosynbacter amalyticus]|uniref:Uncharacterized protein n=1 Tax=Candidatus Mycosynbacter amalyticus TaxID=2665156 RepID=A0A857MNM0_9BACT|nr:cadmium-containing carbonic anhydrase [Candidatus Mycosynbacter amalyticus]QHN42731.1 hypothetical protein GII36_02575 [Candidatus Mycosynbacter amalyticus]
MRDGDPMVYAANDETERKPSNVLYVDFRVGEAATGGIEGSEEQIDTVLEFVKGTPEAYAVCEKPVVCKCIDGRSAEVATEGPNAAGGTFGVAAAIDLARPEGVAPASHAETLQHVISTHKREDHDVGGHTDTHASGDNCGCGAVDRVEEIYTKITDQGEKIRELAEAIYGEPIDNATHARILSNAQSHTEFDTGAKIRKTFEASMSQPGSDTLMENLEGSHNEKIALINVVPSTTLSRQDMQKVLGNDLQAFNVDAWAFEKTAASVAASSEDARAIHIAMLYYNVATALTLCGPNMRIVVRSEQSVPEEARAA